MSQPECLDGHWKGILLECGFSPKHLSGKNVPCPFCGGKDRFRYSNLQGKGTWICSQCGHGNGYSLVMRLKGVQFKEAAQMARKLAGKADRIDPPKDPHKLIAERRALWRTSKAISHFDVAGKWITHRCGLIPELPNALRIVRRPGGWAMLAKVTDPEGVNHHIHRTLFDDLGRFVERKYMPGPLPCGGAIRLREDVDEVLGVAEGIETALSASALFGLPVWSTLDAGNMQKFKPPKGVTMVRIFADHDKAGLRAAYTLAARLISEDYRVTVDVPPHEGEDWNDVHMIDHKDRTAVKI